MKEKECYDLGDGIICEKTTYNKINSWLKNNTNGKKILCDAFDEIFKTISIEQQNEK